jgi:hypothetical protein
MELISQSLLDYNPFFPISGKYREHCVLYLGPEMICPVNLSQTEDENWRGTFFSISLF